MPKSDGNFNKEISMLRGNEVNEFSATITDVAGEETVNFYFTSVAETVDPFNTPNSSISIVDPTVSWILPKSLDSHRITPIFLTRPQGFLINYLQKAELP